MRINIEHAVINIPVVALVVLEPLMSMVCRSGCGACCIAPSISSPIPQMPQGKPAGVRCIQLAEDFSCLIFHSPERPSVCASFKASHEMCGQTQREALTFIHQLEIATQ